MKSTEFNNMTEKQLEKLSFDDLKKLVSQQGKSANKRYYRIKSDPESAKYATAQVEKSGGSFGVTGKTSKASLLKEAKRIQNFNKAKSGTVSGARALKSEAEKRAVGKSAKQAEKEESKKAQKDYAKKEKEKARKEAEETGKKLSKTKRKQIEKEARKVGKEAGKKAKAEVEQKVKKKFAEHQKSKQDNAKHDRGAYYYSDNIDMSSEETDSKYGSPEDEADPEDDGGFMPTGDSTSPLSLANKDDSDFREVSSNDILPQEWETR